MMYLSKGTLAPQMKDGITLVSRCGRTYALGPELAQLWRDGQFAPCQVLRAKEQAIGRLQERGLVSVTEESGPLGDYRLFTDCIICPNGTRISDRVLPAQASRIWAWINGAGLRLTTSELVRLEERQVMPAAPFLGEAGRQCLTEVIYTADTIRDGILETLMEHSPARDGTVAALLRLLRSKRLLLI